MPQSIRWKQAAEAEGFRSAGAWLAVAADAYLKVRAKAGLPLPLAWHLGTFKARLMDGREVEVRGMVSPPFGVFQGTSHGPDRNKLRTLTHLPSHRIIATLRSSRQCRASLPSWRPSTPGTMPLPPESPSGTAGSQRRDTHHGGRPSIGRPPWHTGGRHEQAQARLHPDRLSRGAESGPSRAPRRDTRASITQGGGRPQGGLKGGKARAEKLTPEERAEIARKAAAARWSRAKP